MTQLTVRGDLVNAVIAACTLSGIRAPDNPLTATGNFVLASYTFTWTPDLSTQDQSTLASLVKLAIGSTLLTKAERDFLEPDFNTLRAYANAASPTNAQTIAAVKSIIDVLRAFVRD